MQLFVLGPAFGLPSIDADCIAAAALLRLRDTEQWTIVPTHDDQTHRLPCLVVDNETIQGFRNISRYLGHDSHLGAKQRADAIAISSFLESRARPLLDISLYVSFDNYTATRTAFTAILPWYANYVLPPRRRAAARARTEHLGIASIDVDDIHDDLSHRPPGFDAGQTPAFEAETHKRASLLLGGGRMTVRSMLERREHAAVFKLHALAEAFFAPLQDMLEEQAGDYLLGTEQPTAVDCLAYGYLALMLFPALPQDWLAKTMRRKFAPLERYAQRMRGILRVDTDVQEVMFLAQCNNSGEAEGLRNACTMALPWGPPAPAGIASIATTITRDLVARIPLLGLGTTVVPAVPSKPNWARKYRGALLATAATAAALFGYYVFTTRTVIWPRGDEIKIFGKKRLTDYGHIGAALAGVSLLGQQATRDPRFEFHQQAASPVEVEVEVERNG